MSAMLSVQKGIPLPEINRSPRGVRRKYPLETMQVGEMFFEPGRNSRKLSAYISRETKDMPGKFSVRHCWMAQDAAGVWCPAEPGSPGAAEGTGVWRIE